VPHRKHRSAVRLSLFSSQLRLATCYGKLLFFVALKCYPRAESRRWTELALDDAYRTDLLLGLGHLEHQSLPPRQVSGDFQEFLLIFDVLWKDNLLRR